MDQANCASPWVDASAFKYVVGVDIGSQTCSMCAFRPDKSQGIKPTDFANATAGFTWLLSKLESLGVPPAQILIGLEATSRYGENLYHFLQNRGYQLCLLHPRQTHEFAQRRGLRAKTDKLDASTIARVLLSGEARVGYVPTDLIATWYACTRVWRMKRRATRTRSRRGFRCSFPSSARWQHARVGPRPLPCSSSIPVLRRWPRRVWKRLRPSCMNWLRATMDAKPPSNWSVWPSTREALAWPPPLARSASRFSLISLSIPRPTWPNCKPRSTNSSMPTQGPKDSKVCPNLAPRRWRS